tara:strand:+ start:150 stop:677 length:528 start_codon:yes stop_codon:yes gene_type:complete
MIINNPECFRKNIQKILKNKLTEVTEERGGEKFIINLEIGIYNYAIINSKKKNILCKWDNEYFSLIYLNKFYTIVANIDNNNIIKLIKGGNIESKDIPFLTHQELDPNKWRPIIRKKKMRDKKSVEQDLEGACEDFTCFKCGNNKTTYTQAQTRGADEPMTTFVSCLMCPNKWKM